MPMIMTTDQNYKIVDNNSKRIVVTNPQGKEYNYGFRNSMGMHESTDLRFSKLGRCGVSKEKILIRILDLLDAQPELKKQVTEFDGYRKMRIE
jgi:hypothetical protein